MHCAFRASFAALVLAAASTFGFGGTITSIPDAKNDDTDVFAGSLIFDDSLVTFSGGAAVSGSYHVYNADHSYDLTITFDAAAGTATGTLDVQGVTHGLNPGPMAYHSTDLAEFDLQHLNESIAGGADDSVALGVTMDERDFLVAFNAGAGSTVPVGTRIVTEAFGIDRGSDADTWSSEAVAVPTPASFGSGSLLLAALGAFAAGRRRRRLAVL